MGAWDMESNSVRPLLILGALAVLIVLNILEFKGKRKRDAAQMAEIAASKEPAIMLAHKQYLQTQNIEQVVHIINSVLIAMLLAVLSA
jgi:hypothetical protein